MSKLQEFLDYWEIHKNHLRVNFKTFKKLYPNIKEYSSATHSRYRKELGFTDSYKKHDNENFKRKINRNNYLALDGAKFGKFDFLICCKVVKKESRKFFIMCKKREKDSDYHSIETLENLDNFFSKLHNFNESLENYCSVSDHLKTYKTYFKNERKHSFIKNKNASTSPERRIKDFKKILRDLGIEFESMKDIDEAIREFKLPIVRFKM